RPRALVVALALPLPVQSRQIAGAVVLVQVELHAAFVGFDGLAEVDLPLRRGRRLSEKPFEAAAKQPETLRSRSGSCDELLEFRNRFDQISRVGQRKGVRLANLLLIGDG